MRRSTEAYATAAGALAAAVLLRWLLDPFLADSVAFAPVFGAITIAVWVGGYRPACIAAALGFVICNYLFVAPRYELGPFDARTFTGLIAYAFTCAIIIWIGESTRRAQQLARERGELVQVTLASIGDAVITTGNDGRVTY